MMHHICIVPNLLSLDSEFLVGRASSLLLVTLKLCMTMLFLTREEGSLELAFMRKLLLLLDFLDRCKRFFAEVIQFILNKIEKQEKDLQVGDIDLLNAWSGMWASMSSFSGFFPDKMYVQ